MDRDKVLEWAEQLDCPQSLVEDLAVSPESRQVVRKWLTWRLGKALVSLGKCRVQEELVRIQAKYEAFDEALGVLDHLTEMILEEESHDGN